MLLAELAQKALVYAFEPSRRECNALFRNIELNNVSNIVPLNLAAGDSPGVVNLDVHPVHTGLNRVSSSKGSFVGNICLSIPMDSLIIGLERRIDVCKIDVEGYELFVLNGMERLLSE